MFETSVYRKASNAEIALSTSPRRSCVKALLSRITTHYSNAEARNQEWGYPHRRYRISQRPHITDGETIPPTCRALPYVKNVSELVARHSHPFHFVIAHKTHQITSGYASKCEEPIANI